MITLSEKLNQTIQRFTPNVQDQIEQLLTLKQLDKGTYLLEEGSLCNNCYVVEEGILRKFLIADGKEITTELYFKNDVAVSFESFCLHVPSKEWIQVLTDATVFQLNFDAFQSLKKEHPELIQLDLVIAEYYTIWIEQRLVDFRTLSATQRYLKLLNDQPHYLQQIPLTIIASYLGVAIETLSRIRSSV